MTGLSKGKEVNIEMSMLSMTKLDLTTLLLITLLLITLSLTALYIVLFIKNMKDNIEPLIVKGFKLFLVLYTMFLAVCNVLNYIT